MNNVVKISKAKKKSKNHVGFLGLLLVTAIVCFLLLSPIFAISEITVIGNESVTSSYIISASEILYGENIFKMNKFNAIDKINNLPIIAETYIKRAWPNGVVITVKEKNAIAEVKFYGSKLLISEDGDVLSVVTDNSVTGLPVLSGITVMDVITGQQVICKEEEKLKKYLEVLKRLKENDMLNGVTKLLENDGFLICFENGHIAFLGEVENLQKKLDWLKSILKKEENASYIDLHNLDKVITKPVWGTVYDSEADAE